MQQEEIDQLLEKKHAGNCTPEEIAFLESWYLQWNKDLPLDLTAEELHEDLLDIKAMNTILPPETKSKKLKQSLLVAASLFLILSTALFFYLQTQTRKNSVYDLALHDINPGGNKASITLANGQKLDLNNLKGGVLIGKSGLAYNDGTDISQMNPASGGTFQQLTLATPKGGQYQITLSDGTRVWLNAASALKFPSSFAGLKERRVELTGEAYFEVNHNAKQPFRVQTASQIAEDLGTSFNINSYTDEASAKTTLIAGAMQVQSLYNHQGKKQPAVVLSPSQQASINPNGIINVRVVNTAETMGWKNGDFVFDGENLKSAMRRIARWYDVEVAYETDAKASSTLILDGLVSRKSKLSEVLKWIETVGDVRFKIEGRRVTVTE
ncbi:FecR protein [Pedobacter steynii]|uniref:FecR protein n=2 Tax=Pedobacter steynii TaxID=430522 RepID=A0A1G9NMX0_9SPHI|nr:FecR protein [Pedobacter steynii]